ncbi:MAG TPA: SDR family NAD(P)-dependent oxidoreductase [Solirubrobacteraceae bacterium]|jgi:short-subunit dehydrogenase|nr:SDR family NAD(P)-dependent oxidoreductase [Solirubrobacteraceae bacterium]
MNVAGTRVLLTGASGGLGQAIARQLAAAGAHVVLSGRRADVLEALAAEISGEVAAAQLDDANSVRELAEAHTDVDILVSNAGLSASGVIDTWTEEQIDRALDVNLRSAIVLTRMLVPQMVRRGTGHVVFMSSLAGKSPTAGSSLYNATKFGLRGFAGAMRAELHGTGVGVSAIFPGFIRDAGMFHVTGVKLPAGVGTKSPEHVAKATLRAIERNKAEIDVAPVGLRLGSVLGGFVPDLAAAITRRSGGDEIAKAHETAHMSKR